MWNKVKANGVPPEPRYYHTMDLFTSARILVIHGGMNCEKIVDNKCTYYYDVHAFDLV